MTRIKCAFYLPEDSSTHKHLNALCDDLHEYRLGSSFPTLSSGATPLPKTRELLANQGITATNMFIHTPICCPSRSELLSGR